MKRAASRRPDAPYSCESLFHSVERTSLLSTEEQPFSDEAIKLIDMTSENHSTVKGLELTDASEGTITFKGDGLTGFIEKEFSENGTIPIHCHREGTVSISDKSASVRPLLDCCTFGNRNRKEQQQ